MSNRELVIDLVSKMPEDLSLDEIARRIAFIGGVNEGIAQSERGEGITVEEARRQIKTWTTKSS